MKRLRTKERGPNEPPCPAGHLAAMVLSSTPVQTRHIALVLNDQDKPGCPLMLLHADQPLPRHHAKHSITCARATPLVRHGVLLGRYTSPSRKAPSRQGAPLGMEAHLTHAPWYADASFDPRSLVR